MGVRGGEEGAAMGSERASNGAISKNCSQEFESFFFFFFFFFALQSLHPTAFDFPFPRSGRFAETVHFRNQAREEALERATRP